MSSTMNVSGEISNATNRAKLITNNIVSSNQDIIIYVAILIRIGVLYLSSRVSSNIMSQIYTEKVLLRGEEPPSLTYQLFLFVLIDFFLSLIIILFIYMISTQESSDGSSLIAKFIKQYFISLIILFTIIYVISNVMYRKKYFLYKDDGLRAVRALDDLIFNIGMFIMLIPFYVLKI